MSEEITGLGVLRYSSGSPAVVVVRSGSEVTVSAPPSWDFVGCAARAVDDSRVFIFVSFASVRVLALSLHRDDGTRSDHCEAGFMISQFRVHARTR